MNNKRGVPVRTVLNRDNLLYRGIPKSYTGYTIEDYKVDRKNKCQVDKKKMYRAYLDNLHEMFDSRVCLLNYGANGTGKTMLSSLIVKEGYRLRYETLMITLADLISLMFKTDKTLDEQKKIRYITEECHFLVLDEVGKENFTKTGSNINVFENILRNATKTGQVVIINTNLPLDELYDQYGASITSLIDGEFTKLIFEEEDYRPKTKKGRDILMEAIEEEED